MVKKDHISKEDHCLSKFIVFVKVENTLEQFGNHSLRVLYRTGNDMFALNKNLSSLDKLKYTVHR